MKLWQKMGRSLAGAFMWLPCKSNWQLHRRRQHYRRSAVTLPLGRTPPLGGPLLEGPLRPALKLLPKLPLARDPGRLPPPVASRSSFNTLSTVLRLMNLCAGGQGPGRGELSGSKHSVRAAMHRIRCGGRRSCFLSSFLAACCTSRLSAM